jgi:hypothetical protein
MGLGALLAAALLVLSGCAVEGPLKPAGLEQKIESARSRSDHEEIASLFEQEAGVDRAAAAMRHRGLARAYDRPGALGGNGPAMGTHCRNLARTYEQAAEENLVLAKMHRQVATEVK